MFDIDLYAYKIKFIDLNTGGVISSLLEANR